MKSTLISILTLASSAALAHTGHVTNDAVHGFLHVEHIILIVAIGTIAYVVHALKNR